MFGALKTIATMLLVASLVASVAIQPLSNAQSGMPTTVTWTPDSSLNQPFNLLLVHPSFNDFFAIANNVDPSKGQLTVTLPEVPAASNYNIRFVSITNNSQSYGESPSFSIAPTPSTSDDSTATTSHGSGSTTLSVASTTVTSTSEFITPAFTTTSTVSAASQSATASSAARRAVHDFAGGAVTCAVLLGFLSATRML